MTDTAARVPRSKLLEDHPTVRQQRDGGTPTQTPPAVLEPEELRALCLACGADDVGFVSLDRPELNDQRAEILAAFPAARSIIAFVCRMNREPVRSPARSLANMEFHHVGDQVTQISHDIARQLETRGVRAMNEPVAFPMEQDRWPRPWIIALKPIAVAAGLGEIGIHRNVIHPKFGNFILLGAVVVDRPIGSEGVPVAFNPCLECKLCVAACPVGAISPDGHFNFNSCYTHNYREFMSGFIDWVETVADSGSAKAYRARVSDPETVSMWQSLSGGPNYKAAYCMAVCPAGEDVIGPFLQNRNDFLAETVKPLQAKQETIYVVPGTDAEAYTLKRYPHKTLKRVKNGLRVPTVRFFVEHMEHVFQRDQAKKLELDARYHLTFTGSESEVVTVVIREGTIDIKTGLNGRADLSLVADSRTWVRFLAKETGLAGALIRGRIRFKGPSRLLVAFGKCFPSS